MALRPHHGLGFTDALMRSLGEGVYATDAEGRMAYMNPAAEAMLGWSEDQLRGRDVHEAIHFQDERGRPVPAAQCRLLGVMRSGVTVRSEGDVFTRRDGSRFPVAFTSSPILEDGVIAGAVVAFRDITERRAAEAQRASVVEALQQSLLPPALPSVPGLELAARYMPAGEDLAVGGDFYDVLRAGDAWGIAIGDVMGKGPGAAGVTGVARWALHGVAQRDADPGEALRVVNGALLRHPARRFVTVVYGRLVGSPEGAVLRLAVGGHALPLVVRAGGEVETAGRPGTLLGAFPDPDLPVDEVVLRRGDTVALFTDGLLDPRGRRGSLRSPEAALGGSAGLGAEEAVERLMAIVDGTRQADDVAVLAARIA